MAESTIIDMADTTTPWHGRDDSADSGDTRRWHHVVRPFDGEASDGVALIGFACDEGVRRNGGRPGAAEGPAALRAALANMPLHGEPALYDAGDVSCDDGALDAAQARLAARVAQVRAQRALPVVLGGGHEIAFGTFQGLTASLAPHERLLIVNLDAHFDLREAAEGNSGTPFRQIHDWCVDHRVAFDYRVLGVSRYANTRALFDRADRFGVRYWEDETLQDLACAATACAELANDLARADAIYLTICLDVLPGDKAPGVSAPAALGVPLACIERIADTVMASGKVAAFDIAEFNPRFDRDGSTARIAARLVARIARDAARACDFAADDDLRVKKSQDS
jgi:formiminoglutamase